MRLFRKKPAVCVRLYIAQMQPHTAPVPGKTHSAQWVIEPQKGTAPTYIYISIPLSCPNVHTRRNCCVCLCDFPAGRTRRRCRRILISCCTLLLSCGAQNRFSGRWKRRRWQLIDWPGAKTNFAPTPITYLILARAPPTWFNQWTNKWHSWQT